MLGESGRPPSGSGSLSHLRDASRENADGVDQLLRDFPAVPVVLEHSLCLNLSTDRAATLDELARLSRHRNANVELCDLPVLSGQGYLFADMHATYLAIIENVRSRKELVGELLLARAVGARGHLFPTREDFFRRVGRRRQSACGGPGRDRRPLMVYLICHYALVDQDTPSSFNVLTLMLPSCHSGAADLSSIRGS